MNGAGVELVVGADGMIGSALLRSLRSAGRRVLGTTRRPTEVGGDTCYLDLAEPPSVWDGPPVRVAYFCAAVARLDLCRKDPAGSARVNVTGTRRLARVLAEAGAFVVYLSTNQVFDGTVPYRRPEEATCPQTEYGRQKAAAEEEILQLGASAAVLRLTKIFGDSVPLFTGWAAALSRGERIRPFTDMSLAPVPVDSVVAVLERLGERRPGIYHLSGNRDMTYAEAAGIAAELFGADPALIEPAATRTADPSAEPPPRHTTLDVDRLPESLGVAIPDVSRTIRDAFLRLAG